MRPVYKKPNRLQWADLGSTTDAEPHFQHWQFDEKIARKLDDPPALSPEANRRLFGDKTLRSKIATLLVTPCSIFEAAAFKVD